MTIVFAKVRAYVCNLIEYLYVGQHFCRGPVHSAGIGMEHVRLYCGSPGHHRDLHNTGWDYLIYDVKILYSKSINRNTKVILPQLFKKIEKFNHILLQMFAGE